MRAPFTEAEFEIRWGTGIDSVSELIDLGLMRGLVDKTGAHLGFAGTPLGKRSRAVTGHARREHRAADHAEAGDSGDRAGAPWEKIGANA